MSKKDLSRTDKIVGYVIGPVIFFVFWVYLCMVLMSGNSFPYSDEWIFVNHMINEVEVSWLFQLHNDHMIPFVKIYYMILLKLGNFDFRIVQLTNGLILFIFCFVILRTLHICRGYYEVGDIAIPLMIFSIGFDSTIWGFDIQFISSTFFLIGISIAITKSICRKSSFPTIAAFICLLMMLFCGMNGVIPSLIISFLLIIFIRWITLKEKPDRISHAILTLCFLTAVGILSIWRPSSASSSSLSDIDLIQIIYNFLILLSPTPIVKPNSVFNNAYWFLNIAMIGTALIILVHRLTKRIGIWDLSMLFAIFSGVVLLFSIAIGRQEISLIASHYGFLSLAPVLISWIVLSLTFSRPIVIIIGIFFMILNLQIYIDNLSWRASWGQERNSETLSIQSDLSSGIKTDQFVEKYINRFYYVHDLNSISVINSKIHLLHKEGIYPYTLLLDE